jgi:predicted DCC family thiol-disulfide oxidoreductase YuxK
LWRRGAGENLVPEWRFKAFYDGACPFCRIEAKWLTALNHAGHLAIEDIAAPDFDPTRYQSTLPELMGSFHGVFPDGRKAHGMEAFREAYRAVGLGWVLAPTGWPVLRPLFDCLYAVFARYRVRLGRVFGRSCAGDRCSVSPARRSSSS